jgi:pimeloyl-ACP methyl ester carboxylesterase
MSIDTAHRWRNAVVTLALAIAASGVVAMNVAGQSANPPPLPSLKATIVFVHGAWADGSIWSAEIQQLQDQGYNVRAVQLPLSSLEDDAATVRRVLEQQTGPTIVVAHSYGGAVASQLGPDAPNVVGLVFVDAFMLDEGESVNALVGSTPPPWLANLKPDSAGYLSWDEGGFLKYFAPDVDPAKARVMWAVQKPINSAILDTVAGPPSWKAILSWYLIGDDDLIIPPAAQEQLADRAGATIAHTPGSHVTLVTHPDAVVELIEQAAAAVGPGILPVPPPAP